MEKNKPQVRFKGFTENWKEQELGEVLTERKVLQKITEDAPILAFAAGQGVIDRSERKSNNRDHLTHDQENKIYKLTELNDIVYNPSNLKYGAIDRNKHGRGVISPIYVTFTTEEEASFIELIVKSEKFKLRALQYEEGTVVKRQSVKPENLLSLKVNISTSKDEQKKIGVLIQNLDKLITEHQQKHSKLKVLKKAMLSKMFPQQGQTVPDIRFKGFTGNWEEKKLSELSTYNNGKGNESNQSSVGKYELINLNSISIEGGLKPSGKFVNQADSTLNENDIVMVLSDVGNGDLLGRVALIRCNNKYVLNQRVALIRPNNDISPNFLYYNINANQLYFKSQGAGMSQLNLSKKSVEDFKSLIPKDINEQIIIGQYLNNIDNLISNHKIQIEKLQNIKKAFLAKMFI